MANLLEPSEETMIKNLLLSPADDETPGMSQAPPANFKPVAPTPGFCLKTKTDQGQKIFINVCQGENLPKARDISDEELLKLIESEDPSGYRVPLSIGEPHAEVDKGGAGCTAYDIIINPEFYKVTQERDLMLGFFLTIVLEGVENKYNIVLDRNWKILKNRKFVGTLTPQNIRTQPKPFIQEMESPLKQPKKPLVSEITSDTVKEPEKSKAPRPPFIIIQEPAEGHPEYLVAEVHLPKVKSAATFSLEVGEDRILLETRSNIYHLDIYLPYNIVQDETAAQYNGKTKILTITMPVLPAS